MVEPDGRDPAVAVEPASTISTKTNSFVSSNPPSQQPPVMSTRNPFVSQRFTRWWLATMVAGTGIGIQTVTVPLFIRGRVALDARAIAIAGALIAQTLPGALLTLLGGAIADRVERRRILVRTYSIVALTSIAYVVLAVTDFRLVWPVYLLAAVVGSAFAFTNPARQSMLRLLVTPEQLQNGVILGTTGYMATFQFLGPSIGGLVADAAGLVPAFALEVVLLAAAAATFGTIGTDVPTPSGRSILGDLMDGLRYVRSDPAILSLLLLSTTIGLFFIGPFGVTVAILVPDVLHASDKWVGLLTGCFGGGVLIGSMLLTLLKLPRRGIAVGATTLVGGFLSIAYGLSSVLWVSALLQFVSGLNAAVFVNYAIALLQERSDPSRIGRVMSMYSLAFFASMPIGYAQAGLVTDRFGPQTTLVESGVLAALVGLVCLIWLKPVRNLD
jgi:MFS family permease